MKEVKKSIGLVLSGGGARGFAHLGVLKALTELKVNIKEISGTSAGAIAGSLFAAGYQPDKILKIIDETNVFNFLRPALLKPGLISMEKVEEILNHYLPENSFESLKLKLFVNATDLNSGEEVFFHSGPLIKPILASSCIPVIFSPVHHSDRLLIDGGVVNNFPFEPLKSRVDYLIGVNCNPLIMNQKMDSIRKIMERSFDLAVLGNVKGRLQKVDFLIEDPTLGNFSIFDKRSAKTIFDIGYKRTHSISKQLLSQLN